MSGSHTFSLTATCPPECNFQSEKKIEPDLRLHDWNQVELLPCSTARFAVLHGSSTTWFQTSRYCRAKVEFNSIKSASLFSLNRPMNEETKQNKEADLAESWVRRDLS